MKSAWIILRFADDFPARSRFLSRFDPKIRPIHRMQAFYYKTREYFFTCSFFRRIVGFAVFRFSARPVVMRLIGVAKAIKLEINDLNRKQDKEGVVKYRLNYTATPPVNPEIVAELNAWRTILYRLGLTGQDPRRYDGLAYGNVSIRQGTMAFLISGTQTGGQPKLSSEHYSLVTGFDLEQNLISAKGPIPPSSEALTHAAVYQSGSRIDCVLHVHAPEIWQKAETLAIPVTDRQVGYGTPEMAREVGHLVRTSKSPVIAMGGHEDGIIAFSSTIEEAATSLIHSLAQALA